MRLKRSPKWTPTTTFFLLGLGAFATPSSAQPSAIQVWDQLQDAFTLAEDGGFKASKFDVGFLDEGYFEAVGLPVRLSAGSSYLIVGACDNDCADVDLALKDQNDAVIASDTANDDVPIIRFTPSKTGTYYVVATMHDCRVEPCSYGIGVFVK